MDIPGDDSEKSGTFLRRRRQQHHVIFEFQGDWYIAYHAQTLSKAMGVPKGYRSTHLNELKFQIADQSIQEITANYEGVPQIQSFNPYEHVEAATLGWNAGIAAEASAERSMAVTDIDSGDWLALSKVDFGSSGASGFTASVSEAGSAAVIELRLDSANGQLIGSLQIPAAAETGERNIKPRLLVPAAFMTCTWCSRASLTVSCSSCIAGGSTNRPTRE